MEGGEESVCERVIMSAVTEHVVHMMKCVNN